MKSGSKTLELGSVTQRRYFSILGSIRPSVNSITKWNERIHDVGEPSSERLTALAITSNSLLPASSEVATKFSHPSIFRPCA